MDEASYRNHIAILEEELVCALGCTEPIAVAYAAALARAALGAEPESISSTCSGNIIKNVKSVTVPNSGGLRGIEAAATLGTVGGDATRSLEVLESLSPADIDRAKTLLATGYCTVSLAQDVPNLYVRATATAAGHVAVACIEERHTNVTELTLDGKNVSVAGVSTAGHEGRTRIPGADRSRLTLESIWEFAHVVDVTDVEASVGRQIDLNKRISDEGIRGDWGANIGSTLLSTRPNDVVAKAKAAAAAGSDARMSGCPLPVVIVCGSGNQGITASMPVLEYAHELWSPREELVRAVVLSDLTAVHVKHFVGELSAFCGAVTAGAGAGAGICYLRGGSLAQYEATIVNTIANVGGIVCDGAKPSCAAKISAAVDAAILGCDMALSEGSFLAGDGLVGADAEETIRSMGYVGRVGMHPTDVEILNIMIGKTDVSGE